MKPANQIAVLNTGFLGLLESGMEVDCRVNNVSLEDIQASVFYFGGEIELSRFNVTDSGIFFMTCTIKRGKSVVTLIHNLRNKVAYACQFESFGHLTVWPEGTEFTIIDDIYLV